jgi:hypothetical protein
MADDLLFTKISNPLIAAHADLKVWVWDCGPEEPVFPVAPEAPTGKDGDPKYDLAKIQFKRTLKGYEAALEKYEADEKDHAKWQRDSGGPIERLMWSVDARDALVNDARAVKDGRQKEPRYHISSRTRGYEKLKNGGLPAGMKPGHGQQANLEREVAGHAELAKALRADPVFGQEARP